MAHSLGTMWERYCIHYLHYINVCLVIPLDGRLKIQHGDWKCKLLLAYDNDTSLREQGTKCTSQVETKKFPCLVWDKYIIPQSYYYM